MMRKSNLLVGLILLSFVKISAAAYPLCITPSVQPWMPKAKFLKVSAASKAKKTLKFEAVNKDKATLWEEIQLTKPQSSKPKGTKGGDREIVCGASSTYTAALKATNPSGYLACTAAGKVYLSATRNEDAQWLAVNRSSTGYATIYTSVHGFRLHELYGFK